MARKEIDSKHQLELEASATPKDVAVAGGDLLVAATFTAEPIAESLAFWEGKLGFDLKPRFAPFNQVFQQLLSPSSWLSLNTTGENVILIRLDDWLSESADTSVEADSETVIMEFVGALKAFGSRAPVLVVICPSSRVPTRWDQYLGEVLSHLEKDVPTLEWVSWADFSKLYPIKKIHDEYGDRMGKIPYTRPYFAALGSVIARRITRRRRLPFKAIVLDCDNTLWKGVSAEEGVANLLIGPEHQYLQRFMKKLRAAGMVLCLNSKNQEADVLRVFDERSDMVLKREDLAAWRINWEPKSQNIESLSEELNLGLESFVFVDDNPSECAEVRARCPEVTVLELPSDPVEIPRYLDHVWAFDVGSTTREDFGRTEFYQSNRRRKDWQSEALTLSAFVAGLDLKVVIAPMQDHQVSRVAQLTQRTNQFNSTSIRCTEADLINLASNHEVLVVEVSDRFGEYGLVGMVTARWEAAEVSLEGLMLSCRVLGRGVEHQLIAFLGQRALDQGTRRIQVPYRESERNQPLRNFLESLPGRFECSAEGVGHWEAASEIAAALQFEPEQVARSGEQRPRSPARVAGRTDPQLFNEIATELSSVDRVMAAFAIRPRSERLERSSARRAEDAMNPSAVMIELWAELLGVDSVTPSDHFFKLGGNSLLGTLLLSRVRDVFNVELPLRTLFESPVLESFVEALNGPDRLPPFRFDSGDKTRKLSFNQRQLGFLDRMLGDARPAYNILSRWDLDGELDLPTLKKAFQWLVRRHPVLGVGFHLDEGEVSLTRCVRAGEGFSVTERAEEQTMLSERQLDELCQTEGARPFDLSEGPLIRLNLWRLGSRQHSLLLTVHHLVADGWSMSLLLRDLSTAYEVFLTGQDPEMDPLPCHYYDFVSWQSAFLSGDAMRSQLSYWTEQLAGCPPLLELPTDRPRPAQQRFRGQTHRQVIDASLSASLVELSGREGVTAFMTLLSVFEVLLHRYSGQSDFALGTPVAGRRHSATERVVGMFVNTLVLRARLCPSQSFRELLTQTRQLCLDAFANQDLPFACLVDELQPERDLSYSPIFQVMFVMQNQDEADLSFPGIKSQSQIAPHQFAKFDLTLFVEEREGQCHLAWEFAEDLFDLATIERMAGHFEKLLSVLVSNPSQAVGRVAMLLGEELDRLQDWNETSVDWGDEATVLDLWEQQVTATPDEVAVIDGDARVSYFELDRRANSVAGQLRRIMSEEPKPCQRATSPPLVGLAVERSVDALVGLWGILKSGCAYLPLDLSYPAKRLEMMLSDSGISLCLTQSSSQAQLSPLESTCRWLSIDHDDFEERESVELFQRPGLDALAYVIYTSGSTGAPKGAMLSHRGLRNYVRWAVDYYAVDRGAGAPVQSSLSFDATITSLILPLLAGRSVVMVPEGGEVEGLAQLLKGAPGFSLIKITPAHLEVLNQQLAEDEFRDSARALVLGGEALNSATLAAWWQHAPATRLINEYGPTETVVGCSVFDAQGCDQLEGSVPIGRPIANTRIFVLSEMGEMQPIGVAGELCIAGDGVGLGYWNRAELSRERFVERSLLGRTERVYRTGDLARWRADGNLEFLGRKDQQVKLRGFRIELGEIEAVIGQYDGVKDVAVVVRSGGESHSGLGDFLVAYLGVSSEHELDEAKLEAWLRLRLPAHMIPSQFAILAAMPLTSNGKIDRAALPKGVGVSEEKSILQGETARLLSVLWSQVLGHEVVSGEAHFFRSGGNSLLATQLVARVRTAFGVEMPIVLLFERPKLAAQVAWLETQTRQTLLPAIQAQDSTTSRVLSFSQQRLWFLSKFEGKASHYNMPFGVSISGGLCLLTLRKALAGLLQRHEVLRHCFPEQEGEAIVRVREVYDPLTITDLSPLGESERERELEKLLATHAEILFDLSEGPLFAVQCFKLEKARHVLAFNLHHIVGDGWSIGILLKELGDLYHDLSEGSSVSRETSESAIRYTDFTHWQRDWLRGDLLREQMDYWSQHLQDAPELLELTTDYRRPAEMNWQGGHLRRPLSLELANGLKQVSQRLGATLFMTLLASFKTLLYRYSGQNDIVVGTPIANRRHAECESVVGLFVNTLLLRTQIDPAAAFSSVLADVRTTSLGAYTHQDTPFETLVRELNPTRTLSHSPLCQVMFILQNAPQELPSFPGCDASWAETEHRIATFDLTLNVTETPEGLDCDWEYRTDLFTKETIARFANTYELVLERLLSDPEVSVSRLVCLAENEQRQLLEWGRKEAAPFPKGFVLDRFEAWAQRDPERQAVVFEDESLSYGELNRRVNQCASQLIEAGVDSGTLVGLCVERSLDLMVGILGILKAGGAYVPLDPNYPDERLRVMAEPLPFCLCQKALCSRVQSMAGRVLLLEMGPGQDEAPPRNVVGSDPAYVIYTSGSTGTPKAVEVSHANLIHAYAAWESAYGLSDLRRHLQMANFSFDVFSADWVRAFASGATLVICSRARLLDPQLLYQLMSSERIEFAEFVPIVMRSLLAHLEANDLRLDDMRLLAVGSEAWYGHEYRSLKQRIPANARLVNSYGVSEATVDSTYFEGEIPNTEQDATVPIGKPFPGTEVYVLDSRDELVPVGVSGELFLGGSGVASGYWGRPELTDERFIEVTVAGAPRRVYRTGDLVRWRPDGNIEFLGRQDYQIKLRGFRIELPEIEQVLSRHEDLRQVAVMLHSEANQPRIAAFVSLHQAPDQGAADEGLGEVFRDWLKTRLPDYMVPAVVVVLSEMPLTASGKIDRKTLEGFAAEMNLKREFVVPRTPNETTLADLWRDLLKIPQVGIDDDFFSLGGHSLLATQLAAHVRKAFGVELTIRQVFETPTIAELIKPIEILIRLSGDAADSSSDEEEITI